MSYYMTRHQYKNTKPDDLYIALELFSEHPVARIMKGWTTQTGFPVIMVFLNGYTSVFDFFQNLNHCKILHTIFLYMYFSFSLSNESELTLNALIMCIVQVESIEQVGSSVELVLRQRKFSVDVSVAEYTQWHVPLTIQSARISAPSIAIMNATTFRLIVPNESMSSWISVFYEL